MSTASATRDPQSSTKDAYIVELSGGGDTFAYLVDKAAWTWIQEGGKPAQGLIEAHAKSEGVSEDEAAADLADMKDDNERAMAVSDVSIGGEYESGSKAQRAATRLGLKIRDEYQGYFY